MQGALFRAGAGASAIRLVDCKGAAAVPLHSAGLRPSAAAADVTAFPRQAFRRRSLRGARGIRIGGTTLLRQHETGDIRPGLSVGTHRGGPESGPLLGHPTGRSRSMSIRWLSGLGAAGISPASNLGSLGRPAWPRAPRRSGARKWAVRPWVLRYRVAPGRGSLGNVHEWNRARREAARTHPRRLAGAGLLSSRGTLELIDTGIGWIERGETRLARNDRLLGAQAAARPGQRSSPMRTAEDRRSGDGMATARAASPARWAGRTTAAAAAQYRNREGHRDRQHACHDRRRRGSRMIVTNLLVLVPPRQKIGRRPGRRHIADDGHDLDHLDRSTRQGGGRSS